MKLYEAMRQHFKLPDHWGPICIEYEPKTAPQPGETVRMRYYCTVCDVLIYAREFVWRPSAASGGEPLTMTVNVRQGERTLASQTHRSQPWTMHDDRLSAADAESLTEP